MAPTLHPDSQRKRSVLHIVLAWLKKPQRPVVRAHAGSESRSPSHAEPSDIEATDGSRMDRKNALLTQVINTNLAVRNLNERVNNTDLRVIFGSHGASKPSDIEATRGAMEIQDSTADPKLEAAVENMYDKIDKADLQAIFGHHGASKSTASLFDKQLSNMKH